MGTHPIFESDFDCLTDGMSHMYSREGLYDGQIEMVDEVIWQQHTYVLEKAPAFGFGIAVSGGVDNPAARTGDTSVIISDVVKGGPAWDKLQVNDILNNVNSLSMDNVSHAQAVAALKRAGKRVELTVKRKAVVKVPAPVRGGGRSTLGRSRHRSGSYSRDSRDRSYSSDRGRSRSRYSRSRSRTRSRSDSYSDAYSDDYSDDRRSHRSRSARSHRSGRSHRSRRTSAHSRKSVSRSRPDLTDISPLSPDKPDEVINDSSMMRLPVKAQEPERVILQKGKHSKESYGIRLGTRIFIQDVQPNSLADQRGLKKGDTVLEINGTGCDNKTVNEAIQLISSGKGNKLSLFVQRQNGGTVTIPTSHLSRPNSRAPSRSPSRSHSASGRSATPPRTSQREPVAPERTSKPTHIPEGAVKLPAMNNSVAAPPPSRSIQNFSEYQETPVASTQPVQSQAPAPVQSSALSPLVQADEKPRQIIFMKAKNVGIRLAGGNDVGIFVASVQDGSPASQQGLRNGDQILEVNGLNFRQITREEAVISLMDLPVGSEVRIYAQFKPRHYESILERGTGDSFYIRTHFKYETNQQHELSFKKGCVFLITDTLYQGIVGAWLASMIGRNSVQVDKGVIPNRSRAEQLKICQDKKAAQLRQAKTGRGIQSKLFKGKNKNMDAPVPVNGAKYDAYERVVLREAGFKRPVVIFGPLADITRESLESNHQDRYEIARSDSNATFDSNKGRKGIIKLTAINEVIEKNKHAILDITPTAVDKLNYSQLYPIVIFLKAPNAKTVKDRRSQHAVSEVERKRSAKKLFERACKLERGYNYLFTDVIRLDEDDWLLKVHTTISDQQNGLVWVSEKVGSACEDDDSEYDEHNDDRLSHVSAPMSDYSCTTINSEMNRSIGGNEVSEEEEEDENAEPFQMPEESESQHESYSQDVRPDEFLNKNKGNLRRVPREHSPEMPPPPVEQPPQHESESEEEQYIQPHKQNQDYHEPPVQYNHQSVHSQVNQGRPSNPRPVTDQSRNDRISDPAKLPFSQRVNLFKQSQNDNQRQEYKNYIKSMRDPAQPRLGPKPFRPRSPQGQGQYDSGLERDDMPTRKNGHNFNQSNDPSITESDADTEVVATARGTFDTSGGVLSSVETGVSIVIPRGAIPPGVQQEIYFKVHYLYII